MMMDKIKNGILFFFFFLRSKNGHIHHKAHAADIGGKMKGQLK